jgi:hypothetical protein
MKAILRVGLICAGLVLCMPMAHAEEGAALKHSTEDENPVVNMAGYLMECAAFMNMYGEKGARDPYVTAATRMTALELEKPSREAASWLNGLYKEAHLVWSQYQFKRGQEDAENALDSQRAECDGLDYILSKYN